MMTLTLNEFTVNDLIGIIGAIILTILLISAIKSSTYREDGSCEK